mmetsp:Transcript_5971/g.20335  ORF Transcript_5971/g.20335 Transcript_5971/m.20335 type:complete len:432 (+) Transcript_5971:59-1354(+)
MTACTWREVLVFTVGLISGTGCSLTSKMLLTATSIGKTGEPELFEDPLFQSWVMFVAMTCALPIHFAYQWYQARVFTEERRALRQGMVAVSELKHAEMPLWTYFILAIPSCFDLTATVLCMFGLLYISASVYQLLRGACIVFVAIMKHYLLKDRLKAYNWLGVLFLTVAITLVGLTSVLGAPPEEGNEKNPLVGVLLILCGAFVQSLQYAFEEKMMTGEVSAPPLLVIGMEGLWGTVICTFVLYPLAFVLPGNDHGRLEDPANTWAMIKNSPTVQVILVWYFIFIFLYNTFGVLVTYLLNSVWHAILDNFRPCTVWATDLFIYYYVAMGAFGEPWTQWSFLELGGLAVLLLGTATYNGNVRFPCFGYEDVDLHGVSALATPQLQRSPLIASAMQHARAQGVPDELRPAVMTQYISPKAQRSQYGFISDPNA